MDNYREVNLLPIKSVGASGTETVDIAVTEPLTAIDIYFRATNGAAVTHGTPAAACISKIEIVDGGQVYWSTTGPEAVAAAVYETGKWPAGNPDERANSGDYIQIPLLFGRYLGDESFLFSPSRLLNPQIKVTWARNAGHTVGGYTLGIRVKAMQGVAPTATALMVKNIRTFTSAATGIEATDLPVDLAYRRLFVSCYLFNKFWQEIITNFKIDCDVGKLILMNLSGARFLDMIKAEWDPVQRHSTICMDDGVERESFIGNTLGAAVNTGSPAYFASCWSAFQGVLQDWSQDDAGTSAVDIPSTVLAYGYLPWAVLAYQFGRRDDPASWFVANRYGQVRLELTQGVAAVPVGILLQRPTPMP